MPSSESQGSVASIRKWEEAPKIITWHGREREENRRITAKNCITKSQKEERDEISSIKKI